MAHIDEDYALALWERDGVACLEALLGQPLPLGKAEQTIGLELRDHWSAAMPLLVAALARGGNRLVLRLLYYLDGDASGEVIARCGEPSLAFPDDDLAAWCRPLGQSEHPEARGMLARLRHHRALQVRIAAIAHDRDHCTAQRAIELLDAFPDDAPVRHIAVLDARRDDVLATPDVQAAVVRLLVRRRQALLAPTREFHALIELISGATPPLAEWVSVSRSDAELHGAIVAILERIASTDLATLSWLADNAEPEPARRARALLARHGALAGRFIDISGRDAELCPDAVALTIVDAGGAYDGTRTTAVIEIALTAPPRLGVTFDHAGATWCACLAVRSNRDGYHPTYVWTEVALLPEATSGALGEVAAARRAREQDDLDGIRAPAPLARAVERLAGTHAMAVSLRLHDIIETFAGLVRPHVYSNTLRAAQQQLFTVAMAAGRYDDAVIVGEVVGPLPHARALAAAGRHVDALAIIETIAHTPEIVALERAWRDEVARAKAPRIAVGAAVTHAKFGTGTVLAIIGEGASLKLKIRFATGERTLAASFVTLG